MENLEKKYGFWTATAMVVGIVIGSGVFFKADDVLKASGGHLPTALLAWLIGGSIMVVTATYFQRSPRESNGSTALSITLNRPMARRQVISSPGS